jgi:hypothetical protein
VGAAVNTSATHHWLSQNGACPQPHSISIMTRKSRNNPQFCTHLASLSSSCGRNILLYRVFLKRHYVTIFGATEFISTCGMCCAWWQCRDAAVIRFLTELKCSKPFLAVNLPRLDNIFRKTLYFPKYKIYFFWKMVLKNLHVS